ncbi:YitT family protein, partial [Planococcus sp. SIMBA_160]
MKRGNRGGIQTKKTTSKRAKKILRALAVILGGFITAYGLEAVMIPNNVSDGGVTGMSIVGSQLTGVQ